MGDYTVPELVDLPGARWELLDGEAELAPGVHAWLWVDQFAVLSRKNRTLGAPEEEPPR